MTLSHYLMSSQAAVFTDHAKMKLIAAPDFRHLNYPMLNLNYICSAAFPVAASEVITKVRHIALYTATLRCS